jgi:hypothetical protein
VGPISDSGILTTGQLKRVIVQPHMHAWSALHESRTRNQLLFYTVVQKILGRRRNGSSHILGGNSSGGILIGLGKITT